MIMRSYCRDLDAGAAASVRSGGVSAKTRRALFLTLDQGARAARKRLRTRKASSRAPPIETGLNAPLRDECVTIDRSEDKLGRKLVREEQRPRRPPHPRCRAVRGRAALS